MLERSVCWTSIMDFYCMTLVMLWLETYSSSIWSPFWTHFKLFSAFRLPGNGGENGRWKLVKASSCFRLKGRGTGGWFFQAGKYLACGGMKEGSFIYTNPFWLCCICRQFHYSNIFNVFCLICIVLLIWIFNRHFNRKMRRYNVLGLRKSWPSKKASKSAYFFVGILNRKAFIL